jgi:hypothetical protein
MNLCVVSYTFEQGRRFCQVQNLNFRRAKLLSSDANFLNHQLRGLRLTEGDALIRYGPWQEGRMARTLMDEIESRIDGDPFIHDSYDYNDRIPWPDHIFINLGVSNERR